MEVGIVGKDCSVLGAHLDWGSIREHHYVAREEVKGDRIMATRVGDGLGGCLGGTQLSLAFTWKWTVMTEWGPSIPASLELTDMPEHSMNMSPVTASERVG